MMGTAHVPAKRMSQI